jgi:hypothetical protein
MAVLADRLFNCQLFGSCSDVSNGFITIPLTQVERNRRYLATIDKAEREAERTARRIESDAVRDMASKLQPGEALVSLFKTHGLLRCRMHQSPAKLFKPGAGNQ